jgi:RNA 2',3'-cyclic 3'-phosphodiesterase
MRLFIATSFPSEVLRDLNDRVARLRPRLPSASWVREESQHVTFAFLGEQPESLADRIDPPLCASLAKIPRFEARLHGSGFFPHHRHARVGWVGLQPEEAFTSVANAVRDVVKQNGVTLDGADFKPHLTLLRIRDPWPPASMELFSKSLRDYTSEPFTIDGVTLYSSQLNPKGAIHTPIRVFPLQLPA